MAPRKYALIAGIVMLVLGVIALMAPGSMEGLPVLRVENSYGAFLGIFPMNVLNKLALVLFGIAGIYAYRASSIMASIRWSRVVFYAMGILAILGLFHSTATLGDTWPLFGNEVWAHGVFALLGAYFGYAYSSKLVHHQPMPG